MTEKHFIIKMILDQFNDQYKKHIKVNECDAKSIHNNTYSDIAYEVFTKRFDDFVRIRVYFSFNKHDKINNFSLEVDTSDIRNRLGDEVFVADGTIDRYYKQYNVYKFNWMSQDETSWEILMLENTESLLFEDGNDILLESGS